MLLHLKIWTLLVHLFDVFRALQEGFVFLIGGVHMLRGLAFLTIDTVNVFAIQQQLLHLWDL